MIYLALQSMLCNNHQLRDPLDKKEESNTVFDLFGITVDIGISNTIGNLDLIK